MDQTILRKQRELTDRLNRYRNEYYNHNNPSVSDEVYDRLFDELQSLEKETGVQMANSPTATVGYPVVGKLEKATHEIPLLSLDKVKSSLELCRFMGEHQVMFMLKLDGLTIKLTYEGGVLMEAATRGTAMWVKSSPTTPELSAASRPASSIRGAWWSLGRRSSAPVISSG